MKIFTRYVRALRSMAFLFAGIMIAACGGDSVTKPAPPGTPSRVEAATPLTQSGTAGVAVATRPAVRVLDANGAGVSGVVVHFAVTGGGGAITDATPSTGASGVGTVGSWTLGAEPGQNTLTATVTGLVSVAFTATGVVTASPHRIGVRVAGGRGEFYDRVSGAVFVPRGSNYIRLAPQAAAGGGRIVYHSTFNVGLYDAPRAETALSLMQASGYNVVRVFVQGCCAGSIGQPSGGLSRTYLANIADFLARAKAHGVQVMFTNDGVPSYDPYQRLLDASCCSPFANYNVHYLTTGGVAATKLFWHDFIVGLRSQSAPLDAVFSYEIRNELYFDSDQPPFTLISGTVTTGNGSTYDMTSPAAKQRMMDDNLVFWTDQVRGEILAQDPTALVDVGFFVPQSPNPVRAGDPRFLQPYPAIANSTADFVKLSVYPDAGLTLSQYAQNFGMEAHLEKPALMGEFGVTAANYATTALAARALVAWQVQSCTFHFTGWLIWTWDTDAAEQTDGPFWSARSADAAIDHALAPVTRPDVCVN